MGQISVDPMVKERLRENSTCWCVWPAKRCVKISCMEQPPIQPIHYDSPRASVSLGLMIGLVLVAVGFLFLVRTGEPFLFIVGLCLAAFNWFTNAKQYQIYTDTLVIVYGRPRVKAFPFSEISHLVLLELPIGARLRVHMTNGRRIIISTQNVEEFRDRLEEAMGKFNDTYQGQRLPGEEPENPTPY